MRHKLAVGVTGHRLERLGEANIGRVRAAAETLLAEIERAAALPERRDLRLVTALAEGADSILADAALARGWSLSAALPFFREDYARDFASEAARADYQRRLTASDAVMELPGDRATPETEAAAYERAGHIVLAQVDLLIAVWDGAPARGRGGAAEIVAAAVLRGIPVIHLDPAGCDPVLLWDGLEELDLGQQTADTVARADLSALPKLFRDTLDPPADPASRAMLDRLDHAQPRRWTAAIAYPLLLSLAGVRHLRLTDLRDANDTARAASPIAEICSGDDDYAAGIKGLLAPRFARADLAATRSAQRFRSIYVSNFALAALAVVLSLLGLALPAAKPVLLALELATIACILIQTRAGNRAAWHRLWLDNRALAERLRCLAISTRLGDLDLRTAVGRTPAWVAWSAQATSRDLGLRSARLDEAYLAGVRHDLMTLIDSQIAYLAADAKRMHALEHRLHRLGTILFGVTAAACTAVLGFKLANTVAHSLDEIAHPVTIAATIVGAALPAVGAAIYGIRMQGDFAGASGRAHALAAQLTTLRGVIASDALDFDTLSRRARRVTQLLTEDLTSWLQTYDARPLALPG